MKTIIKKYKILSTVLALFIVAGISYSLIGAGESSFGYISNTTNSTNIDTITTAGDSADASYVFRNTRYKNLTIEYIQAAAPIKSLKLAMDNLQDVKVTYDEADSTIKVWTLRTLGWVQVPFYATVDYTESTVNTLALVTSANDTVSGTTTIARNDTVTGTTTKADTKQTTVQGTGTYLMDSIWTVTGTDTYALINDGSGTDTYALINDGSGTITGTQTTVVTKTDPSKTQTELTVTPDSGTKTFIFMVRGH